MKGFAGRLALALTAALVVACLPPGAARAQHPEYPSERVKAAFIYNFGSYVEWPADKLPKGPFVIDVLGAGAIASALREIVAGRMIHGHPVQVREIESVDDIEGAQMLFVGEGRHAELQKIGRRAADSALLIVSDVRHGLQLGAAINFAVVERRVRFEISMPAAKRAGLSLSSRLLAIALRVERNGRLYDSLPDQFASSGYARRHWRS